MGVFGVKHAQIKCRK